MQDRLAETAQAVFEEVVGRAAFHAVDSQFLADFPADDDERAVELALAPQFQRTHAAKARQNTV